MRRPSDLQIYYQKNLLYGLISSVVLGIMAGIWIVSIGGTDFRSLLPIPGANSVASDVNRTEETDKKNQGYVRSLHPYFSKHEGFLGFVSLQPVGQILATPDAWPANLLMEELYPDFYQDEPPDLATSSGEADDFVLSSGDYYALRTSENIPNHPLSDRNVEVILRTDPEYPFVARDAAKEGEITVLVFIDSNGELATFPAWLSGEGIKTLEYTINGEGKVFQYAMKEEPAGWFFAKNFLKVLPKWTFTPKIESGISVPSLLRIKFNFCLGVNCLRLELEQVQLR